MKARPKSGRHVSWRVIEQRVDRKTPSRDPIQGSPLCTIDVEEDGALTLCVFAPRTGDESLPVFEHLQCQRAGSGRGSHVRLSCANRDMLHEFYGLITRAADRIQVEQQRADDAIREASDDIRSMFAMAQLMSVDAQVGLWGELFVLRGLAKKFGWARATEAWAHSRKLSEEHDFALEFDLEVKTTTREKRHHLFSSDQLRPKPDRDLYVCSVQITTGAKSGTSLTDLISSVRSECSRADLDALNAGLRHAGWRDAQSRNFRTPRWLLRSDPVVIGAEYLPKLEARMNAERVVEWSCLVNLSGLEEKQEKGWQWVR